MIKAWSLRMKLSLSIVFLIALLFGMAAFSFYLYVKSIGERHGKERLVSDLRTALLYIELESPGEWDVSNGRLYKGGLRVTNNEHITEEIKKHFPPFLKIRFGAGSFPTGRSYALHQPRGTDILTAIIRKMPSRHRPGKPPPPHEPFAPYVFENGMIVALPDARQKPVGWLELSIQDEMRRLLAKNVLIIFIAGSVLIIGIILAVLYFIIFRLSAPIDALVETTRRMALMNKKLRDISRTDHLTGLLNRRGLTESLESDMMRLLNEGGTASVALLDLDDFKKINDTYGHECGDLVLLETGRLLQSFTRKEDFSCRWGGEEFLVIFINLAGDRSSEIAERIRYAIEHHGFIYQGRAVPVTATIGLSECRGQTTFPISLNQADKALYRGKKLGKNRVCRFDDIQKTPR